MPACHDATRPHKPSRTEIEDTVEVFDGVTDEALQQLTQERSEERNWLHNTIFLVLDERSTLDKTVLLNANRTLYGPCWEKIDGEDVDKEPEVISDGWWTWRIKFDACECPLLVYWRGRLARAHVRETQPLSKFDARTGFKMIGLLDLKPEFEQEVFLKEKQRFTNVQGVFDSKGALDWYGDPSRH